MKLAKMVVENSDSGGTVRGNTVYTSRFPFSNVRILSIVHLTQRLVRKLEGLLREAEHEAAANKRRASQLEDELETIMAKLDTTVSGKGKQSFSLRNVILYIGKNDSPKAFFLISQSSRQTALTSAFQAIRPKAPRRRNLAR